MNEKKDEPKDREAWIKELIDEKWDEMQRSEPKHIFEDSQQKQ